MKVSKLRTLEETLAIRQAAFLEAWPIAQQLEAVQDTVNGKSAKLEQMNADFKSIKARYPK